MPTLHKLEALKLSCNEVKDQKIRNFVWFIITSILRSTSPVGTAQWQYIQPNKSKTKVVDPYVAYSDKLSEIIKLTSLGLITKSAFTSSQTIL